MKDKVFGVLQRIGRSFMLPIALLPIAGLLLGIGSSFTNETMLEAYRLTGIIYPGGLLYTIFDIMSKAGSVVFDNLALLFAIGVAIGMAKNEKAVAALSSVIAYLIMNTAISALITANGGVEAMQANSTASVLGITSLQMGVFGGIIVGLGVAALHNRVYKIQLTPVLSFFEGTRFVPIICSIVYLIVGAAMFYVWPLVQTGISSLGNLVLKSGYAGTWIYGIIERALIPFGLHHVFYMPFWQTGVGGSAIIDGNMVSGAQNIFFAELASKSTEVFSVSATRFMSGKFPFMIFGLPGAALAMYRCAKPEKRKVIGGLLFSAAITSMLTGITEPIEFTFLFVAPIMYVVHCILAGLSYMLMHILGVGVGMTFSGGIIDLFLFGILQGTAKTSWYWIPVVGIVYFVIYYVIFKFMITKFDLKTPGRDDTKEIKLYTRKDMKNKSKNSNAQRAIAIINGLGGTDNITDLDCCATRLRVTVKNPDKVSRGELTATGASGVIIKGNGIQVVYGPTVAVIKSEVEEMLAEKTHLQPVENKTEEIYAFAYGKTLPLEEVKDEVFASGALGKGIAITPQRGELTAPCSGIIETVTDTNHALTMQADDGAEILLHIGIDTVKLKGKFFTCHVKKGKKVKKGDKLISFELDKIVHEGFDPTVCMAICNSNEYASIEAMADGKTVNEFDVVVKLEK